MISKFFIHRPVFATVLSIVIVLAGLASLYTLPVEQYPEIVPPEIVVVANYPGASAQTIADSVAEPIEQQVNGVEKLACRGLQGRFQSFKRRGQRQTHTVFKSAYHAHVNAAVRSLERVRQLRLRHSQRRQPFFNSVHR